MLSVGEVLACYNILFEISLSIYRKVQALDGRAKRDAEEGAAGAHVSGGEAARE